MPRLLVLQPSPPVATRWAIARWGALAAVLLLLGALVVEPAPALALLWYVAIPVLPATFFLSTSLWRGICPLATLNELGNRLRPPMELSPARLSALRVGGLLLFLLLVPARHLVFNNHGLVLAGVIAAVALLALLLGALFPVRSAWCNALCPVLPVELLYGQAPMLRLERGRCERCTVCTSRGCLDLAHQKSVLQVLGPGRRTGAWLGTPYGAFFAALPGFVVGYNQVGDGAFQSAPSVYATTLGWSFASLLLTVLLARVLRLSSKRLLPMLAALAGMAYYWYSGPAIASHLGASAGTGDCIRGAGMGIVFWWFTQAVVAN